METGLYVQKSLCSSSIDYTLRKRYDVLRNVFKVYGAVGGGAKLMEIKKLYLSGKRLVVLTLKKKKRKPPPQTEHCWWIDFLIWYELMLAINVITLCHKSLTSTPSSAVWGRTEARR